MRKKLVINLLITSMLATTVCAINAPAKVAAEENTANGFHVEQIISDKFNKDTLDSTWKLNDATKELNYNALHCVSPVTYGSGVCINRARMTTKTVYQFTIFPNSGESNSNISYNIGFSSPNIMQKEPDCDARIQFWDQQIVFLDYQHNLALNEQKMNEHVLRGFNGLFSDLVQTDVSLYIIQKNDFLTEMYVEYRRNGELIYSTQSQAFQLENPRYPNGYCGFFWDCVEMDVTNFKVYNDDSLTFEDNLSTNTLTYQATNADLGNFHVNSLLNEKNVYVAQVSTIKMDQANESIKNLTNLERQVNVSNVYDLKYNLKINELNDNSFFGFGFGMDDNDTNIGNKNAIGFIKLDDLKAEVVLVKNGVIDRSNNYQIALSRLKFGKFIDLEVTLDYANNACIKFDGLSFTFKNVDYIGQTGLGLVDFNSTNSSSVELREISILKNSYKNYSSSDISNDFTGKKPQEGDEGFDDPYINTQKYFLGSGVSLEEDWTTGDTSLTFTNAGAYSGFGIRQQYAEFICEFDLEVYSRLAGSYIGLSFGRESIVGALMQAADYGSFLFRCDRDEQGNTYATQVVWGNGYRFDNGTDWNFSPVNIYDANNSKYHMMFVGKNRNLYVYYKAIDAPDSELGILRAVIHNVNIDGYVSIVGNNSASFGVTNYKMVNLLDECTEESELTLRESFENKNNISEKIILDPMSKVQDGKLVMNSSSLTTVNPNLYGILRFTTYEMEDSLQVVFSRNKKVIFDVENNQIVVSENNVKTYYDVSSINLNNVKGKRFEIIIQGDELNISYKGYYDPQDKLSTTVVSHKLATPLEKDTITLSANGKVTIDDVYLFSLDNTTKCAKYDFEDDPNNVNIWKVKKDFDPSKVYKAPVDKKGCKSNSVYVIMLSFSLIGIALACRKKEN